MKSLINTIGKQVGFFALALALTIVALGGEQSLADFKLPITQGKWRLSGSGGYAKSSDGYWSLRLAPSVDYFVFDKLALGLTPNMSWGSDGWRNVDYSAALTYYFAETGQWGYFAKQGATVVDGSRAVNRLFFTTGVGATYFFNPYVSMSPTLSVSYGAERSTYLTFDLFNIAVHF